MKLKNFLRIVLDRPIAFKRTSTIVTIDKKYLASNFYRSTIEKD